MIKYTVDWGETDDSIRDEGIIREKLAAIEKYLANFKDDLKSIAIDVSTGSRWGYWVKLRLRLPGKEVFAEAKDRKFLNALVESRKRLIKQVKEHLAKLRG